MLNRGLRGNLLTWTSLIQALETLGQSGFKQPLIVGVCGNCWWVSRIYKYIYIYWFSIILHYYAILDVIWINGYASNDSTAFEVILGL